MHIFYDEVFVLFAWPEGGVFLGDTKNAQIRKMSKIASEVYNSLHHQHCIEILPFTYYDAIMISLFGRFCPKYFRRREISKNIRKNEEGREILI